MYIIFLLSCDCFAASLIDISVVIDGKEAMEFRNSFKEI